MLFIVEYVEIMYVYTLKYVYIYRIYVYMYLYVNKESLLNLALACGIFYFILYFFLNVLYIKTQSKTKTLPHITEGFSPAGICFSRSYVSVRCSALCYKPGQNRFSSVSGYSGNEAHVLTKTIVTCLIIVEGASKVKGLVSMRNRAPAPPKQGRAAGRGSPLLTQPLRRVSHGSRSRILPPAQMSSLRGTATARAELSTAQGDKPEPRANNYPSGNTRSAWAFTGKGYYEPRDKYFNRFNTRTQRRCGPHQQLLT